MPRNYNNIDDLIINSIGLIIFIIIIIISILPGIIFYNYTSFNKTIVVKEKYISHTYDEENGSTTLYYVVSTDNTTYEVVNLWWKLDFNKADDYARMDSGKSYNVKGYGARIPVLNMFPKIYDFVD